MVMIIGGDPTRFSMAVRKPYGTFELDIVGGIGQRGRMRRRQDHHLPPPMPKSSSRAICTKASKERGPFGEWTGYYSGEGTEPVLEVEAIYHRNDPIILRTADGPEIG